MRKRIKAIDTINDRVGMGVRWLSIIALGVICAEVFMRYVLNHPTSILSVVGTMTAAVMYVMSWGYVQLNRRHIRVKRALVTAKTKYACWPPFVI